jgi:hypothetical protein
VVRGFGVEGFRFLADFPPRGSSLGEPGIDGKHGQVVRPRLTDGPWRATSATMTGVDSTRVAKLGASRRPLTEFVPGVIWLREYPIRYMGTRVNARMTVIRLASGSVIIHSPCRFDDALAHAVGEIGSVEAIIAPGNFHHLHVPSCQSAFPGARTYACPGVEKRAPKLRFDELLTDEAPPLWAAELSQVLMQGVRYIREVIFFHHASKTLIVTDIIENIGHDTPGTNWLLRAWFVLFGMWNKPAPAPEYRFTWSDKSAARKCFERVLEWDFERVILAHGDLITQNAKSMVERAWRSILARRFEPRAR